MNSEPSPGDLSTIRALFAATGCEVVDTGDSGFQITPVDYPVKTLVVVTPFYLELVTVLVVYGEGFRPNASSKLHAFLSAANSRTNLVRFTDGTPDLGRVEQGWKVAATLRYVTGSEGFNYDSSAIKNLLLLWQQDIATCVAEPGKFKVHAMIDGSGPS
jgi:hypothetical protein